MEVRTADAGAAGPQGRGAATCASSPKPPAAATEAGELILEWRSLASLAAERHAWRRLSERAAEPRIPEPKRPRNLMVGARRPRPSRKSGGPSALALRPGPSPGTVATGTGKMRTLFLINKRKNLPESHLSCVGVLTPSHGRARIRGRP